MFHSCCNSNESSKEDMMSIKFIDLLITQYFYYRLMEKGSTKMLSLRELHLTPHFIYLVGIQDDNRGYEYALEIWKGTRS